MQPISTVYPVEATSFSNMSTRLNVAPWGKLLTELTIFELSKVKVVLATAGGDFGQSLLLPKLICFNPPLIPSFHEKIESWRVKSAVA